MRAVGEHDPGVIALFCGSEGVVHELMVTTRIDRATVHELPFSFVMVVWLSWADTLKNSLVPKVTSNRGAPRGAGGISAG